MAILGRLLALAMGVFLVWPPIAEAATCKGGRAAQKAADRCKKAPAPSARATRAQKSKAKLAGASVGTGLVEFVEARGCKLLASESAVRRMRELEALGAVSWDGKCQHGLISGPGVLRQEGVSVEGGRSKRFAYYFSGTAQKGMRSGRWTRETFERFVDDPKSRTTMASLEFSNGMGRGAARPVPVRGLEQHGASFRTRVLEPESGMLRAMAAPAAGLVVPAPVADAARDPVVKLTAEAPAFVDAQSFGFGTGCYMDTLNGRLWEDEVLTIRDRQLIRIHGWAVDDESKLLPEETYLRLESSNGRRFYAATMPEDRPDVARHLGQAAFVKAGFRALVSAENLPPGEYQAMILMNVAGRNLLCGNERKLRL